MIDLDVQPKVQEVQPYFQHIFTKLNMRTYRSFLLFFAGTVWSPRLNVAEFEHNYVVAAELPGASINDIRVEVDNIK